MVVVGYSGRMDKRLKSACIASALLALALAVWPVQRPATLAETPIEGLEVEMNPTVSSSQASDLAAPDSQIDGAALSGLQAPERDTPPELESPEVRHARATYEAALAKLEKSRADLQQRIDNLFPEEKRLPSSAYPPHVAPGNTAVRRR